MRLPFLQLESDLLAHGAAGVAALLGCPVPQALGHIALLRAWAVSRGPTDAAPDGWVPGDNAARLVAAGAHWTGDPGLFSAALGDPGIGLLEVRRDGIRVTGLEPYAEAWDKNTKARERLRKFRVRNAYETRTNDVRNANVPGQTQTQTQTQKEEGEDLPPPTSASAAPEQAGLPGVESPTPPAKPAKKAKKPEPAPDPKPFTAACDMLTRVYAEARKADYGFGLNATRNGKAVRELLWGDGAKGQGRGEPLVPLEELERRWRIGLAWKGFPACNAIWDLKDNWAAYSHAQGSGGEPAPVVPIRRLVEM